MVEITEGEVGTLEQLGFECIPSETFQAALHTLNIEPIIVCEGGMVMNYYDVEELNLVVDIDHEDIYSVCKRHSMQDYEVMNRLAV